MGIIEQTKEKINKCITCHGRLHYDMPDGKSARCECFWDDKFVSLFKKANVDEDLIDIVAAEEVKKMFVGSKTVVACVLNNTERKKYIHSAAYMSTRLGKFTKICGDEDVIAAIFDKAYLMDQGKAPLDYFLLPEFLVFQLGDVVNREFIGSHLRLIIERRAAMGRFTFITIPDTSSIEKKYKDKDLTDLITVELNNSESYLYVP